MEEVEELVKQILSTDYIVVGNIRDIDGSLVIAVTKCGCGSALIRVEKSNQISVMLDSLHVTDRINLADPKSLVKLKIAIERTINDIHTRRG